MFELYGCPTHSGVGATGLIKSIDYLTENFKNLQMNKVPEITCKGPFRANLKNLDVYKRQILNPAPRMRPPLKPMTTTVWPWPSH